MEIEGRREMKTKMMGVEILIDLKEVSRWVLYRQRMNQDRLNAHISTFLNTVVKAESIAGLHPYCCYSTVENTLANGRPLGCKIKLCSSIEALKIIGEDEDQIQEDAVWLAANVINFLHSVAKDFLLSVRFLVLHDRDIDVAYIHTDHKENKNERQ